MDAVYQKLRDHEPVPPADEIEEASDLFAQAKRGLAIRSSLLISLITSMTRAVYTSACDTLAVTLGGDGLPMLMIHPPFAKELGKDGMMFVLGHEAYHLILMHLNANPDLRNNERWVLATEACVNRRVMRHLGINELPIVDGETSGVDPNKVYESYKAAMKKLGQSFLSKDEFFRTDLVCLAELDRMPKPPRMKIECLHGQPGDGQDGQDSQPGVGTPILDPDEVGKLVEQALAAAIHDAKANNNKDAAKELLELMDENPQAAKLWGDLGVASLRGETTSTRKTDMWERQVANAIASRLEEGTRLQCNRKTAAFDLRVTPSGKEQQRSGVIAVDTSGSMPSQLIEKIAALVQEHEEMEVDWIAFDGAVWPFAPGQEMKGGGGTSFQVIDDYVADKDDEPDFVLVVTDGYAPPITPRDPDSWIWLITPDGDDWPGRPPHLMECRKIDII